MVTVNQQREYADRDSSAPRVILASKSPRRRMLLEQIGLACEIVNADIDESLRANETARDYVARLAAAKAEAGRTLSASGLAVIGADTTVCVDGDILGKPVDADEAGAMLDRLSGRVHQVMTGVAVVAPAQDCCTGHRVSISDVQMRELSQAEIDAYCASGEPFDKAGGYAIQGRAAVFVASLSGSYTGVVGLPLFELDDLLKQINLSLWD